MFLFRDREESGSTQVTPEGVKCAECPLYGGAEGKRVVICNGYGPKYGSSQNRRVKAGQCQIDRRNQQNVVATAEEIGMDPAEALTKVGYMENDEFVFQPIPAPVMAKK